MVDFVILGASGQLGTELQKRIVERDVSYEALDVDRLDITKKSEVSSSLRALDPKVVINAAAYTAVDNAESDRESAERINAEGPENLAEALLDLPDAKLIHVSTDYVFSGKLGRALSEEDVPDPVSVYGQTKLLGDNSVTSILDGRALIVRTASVFGGTGGNIVRTFLRLFHTLDEVKVVRDQVMSPTWTGWLSECILDLATLGAHGIVNVSGRGEVSWYDFACHLYELTKEDLQRETPLTITPVTSEEFVRPAPRPAYSALDTSKLASLLGREVLSWEEGLSRYVAELREQGKLI